MIVCLVLEIVKNISENDFISEKFSETAISVGVFDGIHLGHREIIHKLKIYSEKYNLKTSIFTFDVSPRFFLNPKTNIKSLSTFEEKTELLNELDIDFLFIQEFNEKFKNTSAEDFVNKILLEKLHAKYIVLGYNHKFGRNKEGNFQLLQKISKVKNFITEQTNEVIVEGISVSSTKIRELLAEGNVKKANKLLGYNYSLRGEVVCGKQIGRKLGYPTANIKVDPIKLLPENGAYIVDVVLNDQQYGGMLSIGVNPTFEGTEKTVEVYILNFDKNIYKQNISVHFREFLHPEIKFESVEELIKKLDEDKLKTIEFFKS